MRKLPARPCRRGGVGQNAQIVHRGIAHIHANRVVAVLLFDLSQAFGHLCVGLLPADGRPLIALTPHRLAQAIRIFVQIFQRHRLRTNMAATEGVFVIALNGNDLILLVELDFNPTNGFTQWAGAKYGTLRHGAVLLLSIGFEHKMPQY